MIFPICFVLLALDCAGVFHGDLSHEGGALVALVLAIIALVALLLPLRNQT